MSIPLQKNVVLKGGNNTEFDTQFFVVAKDINLTPDKL